MKRYELAVIGAGPAGLSAAIKAAEQGVEVIVFDENAAPGGQLFKQVHKFFGSEQNLAGSRGFRIGDRLFRRARELGVKIVLNAVVIGIYLDHDIVVRIGEGVVHYKAGAVLVATGASENAFAFEGWDLPGVMGAGAAQTLANLHGVRPGQRIVILGTGNVGLVVAYQLLQAGCEVVALADASRSITGYGVHAARVARYGVPFYLPYTIRRAEGKGHVERVILSRVDDSGALVDGSDVALEADTVLLAVGLSPMSQILKNIGCRIEDNGVKGGIVPVIDASYRTSVDGIYAAGNVSSVGEASTAMLEGEIAAVHIAEYLGYMSSEDAATEAEKLSASLYALREGMFAPGKRAADFKNTEEGYPLSESLLNQGYLTVDTLRAFPNFTGESKLHPVIECTQNIPCNPCFSLCPQKCICAGEKLTSLPVRNPANSCIGCGACVAGCPGQAIFLVEKKEAEGVAEITMPYEFLPVPEEGECGSGLSRSGQILTKARVVKVRTPAAYDKTTLLTISVPLAFADEVRAYRKER